MKFASVVLRIAFASVPLFATDTAEVVFGKAAAALAAGQYEQAERGFLAVLKAEPRNVGALGNLGVLYSRMQRGPEAIGAYQKALRIAPGDRFLSTNLGLAYIKQDQYAAALPIFERLAADPADSRARELLAACRLALGQDQAALSTLEPMIRAEPSNAGLLYMSGIALTRLKRLDEAHAAFAAMMEAAGPAQAGFLMGKACYETGQFEQAVEFFHKAIEADPSFSDAHRELGKALISLHDDEGAERELRLAKADDAEALYYLGAVLSHAHPDQAIPVLNKAHGLNPDAWGPLYYLGRVHVQTGAYAQAIAVLEQASRLNPGEPAIYYQLGRALQKTGRQAQARAAFARVRNTKSRSLEKEIDVLTPARER